MEFNGKQFLIYGDVITQTYKYQRIIYSTEMVLKPSKAYKDAEEATYDMAMSLHQNASQNHNTLYKNS